MELQILIHPGFFVLPLNHLLLPNSSMYRTILVRTVVPYAILCYTMLNNLPNDDAKQMSRNDDNVC